MTVNHVLESAGVLLTVLTPLVAVPLTLVTFYLRSLREHQVTWHAQLERRVDAMDAFLAELRKGLAGLERDYTTKEEWLRECLHTGRVLEQLSATAVRLETMLNGLVRGSDRAARES